MKFYYRFTNLDPWRGRHWIYVKKDFTEAIIDSVRYDLYYQKTFPRKLTVEVNGKQIPSSETIHMFMTEDGGFFYLKTMDVSGGDFAGPIIYHEGGEGAFFLDGVMSISPIEYENYAEYKVRMPVKVFSPPIKNYWSAYRYGFLLSQ